MREVTLTRGFVALVDDEDFARVSQFKWCAIPSPRNVYAARNERHVEGGRRQRLVLMHRFIAGTAPDAETDHVDGNGLNNRRENLRTATCSQNRRNSRRAVGGTSRYKGVTAVVDAWRARIWVDGRRLSLGSFPDEDAAARAYDAAARAHYGAFAAVNFPGPGERSALA